MKPVNSITRETFNLNPEGKRNIGRIRNKDKWHGEIIVGTARGSNR